MKARVQVGLDGRVPVPPGERFLTRWRRNARSARARATLLACVAASIMTSGVPTAAGHELGAAKVMVLFSADGGYRIEVTLNPAVIQALGGASDPLTVPPWIAETVAISFDGVDTPPIQVAPATAPPGPGRIDFAGRVPAGAKTFGWRLDLPVRAYNLGTRNEGNDQIAWQWLRGMEQATPVPLLYAPPRHTRAEVFRTYIALGFRHILPLGLDHILFVLGLFLLSLKPRTMLAQVTAFTVAHSITLALGLYGVVSLPTRVVEPLIALSIVFVTVENLLVDRVKPWRVAVVFAFGLVHGMGFAGVLRDLGLPRSEFVTGLVSFNLGVEAGQLAVIALAYLAVGAWFGRKAWYRARVTVPASAVIAAVALVWTFQRL